MAALEEIIREICAQDPRYTTQAYYFIYEALDYTQKKLRCSGHVTGQQLMEGVRQLALERFGMLALTVFQEWGVRTTADFGQVVFNLVSHNAMGKTDADRAEDFENLFDLEAELSNPNQFKREWRIKE